MWTNKLFQGKSYFLTFAFCSIFTFAFISGVFLYTVRENPIKLNINLENKLFTFVPQGWAFFTRNPREAQIIIYQKKSDNRFEEISQRHSSYHNIFGLKRTASKVMSELQFVKRKINDSLYQNTMWSYQRELYSKVSLESITVQNQIKDPILCGEYLVVYQKAVPWAWSRSLDRIKMPAKIIRLNIKCNDREN